MDVIYMHKEDFALNNQQWLICHKTKPNQIIYAVKVHQAKSHISYIYV